MRGNGLCLDSCVKLFPLLDSVLSKAEHSNAMSGSGTLKPAACHITGAVMKTLISLIRAFGELIRNTRSKSSELQDNNISKPYSAGIDVNGEERLRKCDKCYKTICSIRKRVDNITSTVLGMDRRLLAYIREFSKISADL